MPSKDDYALAIIAKGIELGVSPRGIKIALVTPYPESNYLMWSNPADPPSMNLDYDAVGHDGSSTGLFQQQAFDEWGGATPQGTKCRMDAGCSAGLFYDHMLHPDKYGLPLNIDYNDESYSPGQVAQNVQRSAFPDRYDQHWDEAVELYDRLIPQIGAYMNRPDFNEYPDWLSANYSPRNVSDVDLWLLHTQEPPEGPVDNDAAKHLRDFLESSTDGPNPVSYHYSGSKALDGGTTVIDCVDTDDECWAVGNSNARSINFCFAGSRSDMSRQEWIDRFDTVIEAAAYLFVQDCGKYPKLKARVIADPYSDPPGAADHNYCTEFLQDGNNHTDVGPNFPWDIFKAAVAKYASGEEPAPAPTPEPTPVPGKPTLPTGDRALKEILEQQRGPWDDEKGEFVGWPQLGNRTLVDSQAAAIEELKLLHSAVEQLSALFQQQSTALSALLAAQTPPTKAPARTPAKKTPAKRTPAKKATTSRKAK